MRKWQRLFRSWRKLQGFPADTLCEIIPIFHNTRDRYAKMMAAVERDPLGRLKEVEEDLLKEVQRLRAENAYLKKLQALVLEEERHQSKKQR